MLFENKNVNPCILSLNLINLIAILQISLYVTPNKYL